MGCTGGCVGVRRVYDKVRQCVYVSVPLPVPVCVRVRRFAAVGGGWVCGRALSVHLSGWYLGPCTAPTALTAQGRAG